MPRIFAKLLVALVLLTATASASLAQTLIPIYNSPAVVTPNTREQHLTSMLNLQPGQEMLPLTLVVNNGPNGRVPFNWFRINIAGYLLASEQDLHGTRRAVVDVSGRMQAGQSQVIIDCAGEPGATLTWQLMSTPISLTSVEPTSVQQGGTIVLTGKSFNANEAEDKVLINGKPAQIISASATSITARVPADAKPGNASVQVIANGAETKVLGLAIGNRPVPVLHSMNYWMAPPGATLNITGQNFGANLNENKVFFRNTQAQVVYASPTLLQVIIPNWGYGAGQMNIPVWCISNNTRSGNYLPFDIGPKYEGALPPMPGDSYSESSSQASSEASPWPMSAMSESSTESSSEASSQSSSESSYNPGESEAGSEAPGPMIFP